MKSILHSDRISPPATIAILGGGQLGAMLSEAARRMGYRTVCVSLNQDDPAGRWADHHLIANPSDPGVVARLARDVQVITVESEGIEPEALAAAEKIGCRVAPSSAVQTIVRDRRLEKTFLAKNHLDVGPFRTVDSASQMIQSATELFEHGASAILAKTARGGYDGKGQRWIRTPDQASNAWESLGQVPLVIEAKVDFVAEASVIVAGNLSAEAIAFPVFANEHRHGILFQTRMPGGFSPHIQNTAIDLAKRTAKALGVAGLLAVEMFVLADGRVWVNELAARPHNSGHVTLRAATRSQFEMHIAAICSLPLAEVEILRPAVMTNLLGDLWAQSQPDWSTLLADGRATLHLYGKSPRPGRKMGHMIHTAQTPTEALSAANQSFSKLS